MKVFELLYMSFEHVIGLHGLSVDAVQLVGTNGKRSWYNTITKIAHAVVNHYSFYVAWPPKALLG